MNVAKKPVFHSNYEGLKVEEVPYGTTENCYGEMQEYSMDIMSDPNVPEKTLRPVIIFIHGGGFIQPEGKRQSYVSLICRQLIPRGYIAVSPDYPIYDTSEDRLKDNGAAVPTKPPAAIKLVYDFIIKNAEKYGFDTKRIAIIGGSAGATTAYNTIAQYKDLSFTCFGALWGVPPVLPDISHYPPIFSVHGTNDMSYVRQVDVTAAFSEAHISCTLISVGGSGHSPIDKMAEYVPQLAEFLDFHTNAVK